MAEKNCFDITKLILQIMCVTVVQWCSGRLDIPRLSVTAILIFKCPEGAGVGDYSSRRGGGGEGREK